MRNIIFKTAFTLVALAPLFLYAQPDPPGGPVPIDGGLGILLAAGAAYGIQKYRKHNEK